MSNISPNPQDSQIDIIFRNAEDIFNFQLSSLSDYALFPDQLFTTENIAFIVNNPQFFDDDVLHATLNPNDDLPPLHIVKERKRRKLVINEGEKSFYKWKTILKKGTQNCNNLCTICGETFKENDQVIEGAKGQYYHRTEMLRWIRQPYNTFVRDPNTNVVLETYSEPIKKRQISSDVNKLARQKPV
jgi:hypothetical protein